MKAVIVTGPYDPTLLEIIDVSDAHLIVGADSGAFLLAQKEISFDMAIGDFDSVTKKEYSQIKDYAKEIDPYKKTKDFTDTYLAITYCLDKQADEIIVYGGIGSRLDHTYANINALTMGNITFITPTTKMYLLEAGDHTIHNTYKYISFFAFEKVKNLSIESFQYEMKNKDLDPYSSLCVSNEGQGVVSFDEGRLLVVHQNE